MSSRLFLLPPFCVRRFIFQKLALSYGNQCGREVKALLLEMGSVVSQESNFEGHMCGRSLRVVARSAGLEGNNIPPGMQSVGMPW